MKFYGFQDTSSTNKKRRHASFLNQCFILTKRSSLNMFRDVGYYWLRLVIYVALAISLATVYYDLGMSYDSIQVTLTLAAKV